MNSTLLRESTHKHKVSAETRNEQQESLLATVDIPGMSLGRPVTDRKKRHWCSQRLSMTQHSQVMEFSAASAADVMLYVGQERSCLP